MMRMEQGLSGSHTLQGPESLRQTQPLSDARPKLNHAHGLMSSQVLLMTPLNGIS